MNQPSQSNQSPVQESLKRVIDLLHKHEIVESLVHKQQMPRHDLIQQLVHKQNLAELQKTLEALHPADIGYILEALPLSQRLLAWAQVRKERGADILLEVSDAVRASLIADMDSDELSATAKQLNADELADLAPNLPHQVVEEVFQNLGQEEQEQLQSALSFEEGTVGALMDFDLVKTRSNIPIEQVLADLRQRGELPSQTDKLFVVDAHGKLRGVLPLKKLLLSDPKALVSELMSAEPVVFDGHDKASDAASAFERYDLISAPVLDGHDKLIGRLRVDQIMDFVRAEAQGEVFALAGLREEEDLFASVWKSVQNRWAWLAINLITAFIASRVIGLFEDSIAQVVALAALMPIVAGIGGNSGNQTLTMIVRGLALGQLRLANVRQLLLKEAGVGLLNGIIWGSIIGILAYLLYQNAMLGLVMTAAMTLNLLLAAIMGVAIPLIMHQMGRDPALGSSVLITAVTDSGGFFIFLGLASLMLMK